MGKLKDFWTYLITDPNKSKIPKKQKFPEPKATKLGKERTKYQDLLQTSTKTKGRRQLRSQVTQKSKQKDTKEPENYDNLDLEASTAKFKLGKGVLLFILINAILGSSLFYLPSLGVISSGPASLIVWPALYMLALIIMLYIAELVTTFPSSGGTYEYCEKAYGRPLGFTAGWLIWLTGNLGFALNVVAAAQYFIPETGSAAFILQMGFSLVWILALNYMAFRGIDAGATMLVTFGIISVILVSILIIPSFIDISTLTTGPLQSPWEAGNLHPFFTHAGTFSIVSFLLLSFFLISESFFGFETITYLANDAKDPKSLHKVLFAGLAICGVIVTLYILSSLGTVSLHDYVNNGRPWAVQALNIFGQTGQNVIVFGMYLVIIGAAAAWPITSSRLIQAMAKDKLFATHFAKPHKTHKTPYRAVIFQTIAITLFTFFIFQGYLINWGDPYRTTYLIYILLTLITLALILFTVPVLRKKFPINQIARPFKAPLPKAGPILITSFLILLIANWIYIEGSLATSTIWLAVSFLILGIPIYFLIEMYYDKDAILKVNEALSHLAVITEKLHIPKQIHKEIKKDLPNLTNKKILEYGCGIGSITKELAKSVGKHGKIFAVDTLKHNIKMTNKRTRKYNNVTTFHDQDLHDFNIFLPMRADILISVGMLSYMQDPQKIIKKMSKHLNKGAKIRIIDYDKFFHIIPNVEWVQNNAELKDIFKQAKINITVERKRGLLWTYIIIKGHKL